VVLLAGQRTCDSQVGGSSPGWTVDTGHHCVVALGKLLKGVSIQV